MGKLTNEEVWEKSNEIIEEMQKGMCFFEGFLPSIQFNKIRDALQNLSTRAPNFDCTQSVWENKTTPEDWNRKYELEECLKFFEAGKIYHLHFDYTFQTKCIELYLKLIFIPSIERTKADVEIICYREGLQPWEEAKERFFLAIDHLRGLKECLNCSALLIGPDTLNYPDWPQEVPGEWLRVE